MAATVQHGRIGIRGLDRLECAGRPDAAIESHMDGVILFDPRAGKSTSAPMTSPAVLRASLLAHGWNAHGLAARGTGSISRVGRSQAC